MIEGQNIVLRAVREGDLEEFFALSSRISEVGDYWPVALPSRAKLWKKFHETGFWQKDRGILLITDKEDRLIGMINFYKGLYYQEGFELGYRIFRPKDRGKGFTTEALKIFSSYLFSLAPIPRLQITIIHGNAASRRVAEKCGFQFEGVLRKAVFHRGSFHDLEMHSLLREESSPVPTTSA